MLRTVGCMCFICRKWSNIHSYCLEQSKDKMRNKLNDRKAFVNIMGVLSSTNLKHKFLLIHISTNEMAKVDCDAFLSESEPRNLSLLYHFEGEYS